MLNTSLFALLLMVYPNPSTLEGPQEDLENTPETYVIESGDTVCDYHATRSFFRRLSLIVELDRQPILRKIASEMGLSHEPETWTVVLDLERRIRLIFGRKFLSAEEQLALIKDDPGALGRDWGDFRRQLVLDVRLEFQSWLPDFEDSGGDVETLVSHIRAWGAKHVRMVSNVPRDDPSLEESMVCGEMFDQEKATKGTNQ